VTGSGGSTGDGTPVRGKASPVFAGREAEMAALGLAYAEAAARTARTVVVGAEAGGGKTRLVSEFARTVSGEALVVTGAALPAASHGAEPPRADQAGLAGHRDRR
jgi:hypothetical protein